MKPCPQCSEPVAMRGYLDGKGDYEWTLCPHPCHQAAQDVVEASIGDAQVDCCDHADNCCAEWCDMCQEGKARRKRLWTAKSALLASLAPSRTET